LAACRRRVHRRRWNSCTPPTPLDAHVRAVHVVADPHRHATDGVSWIAAVTGSPRRTMSPRWQGAATGGGGRVMSSIDAPHPPSLLRSPDANLRLESPTAPFVRHPATRSGVCRTGGLNGCGRPVDRPFGSRGPRWPSGGSNRGRPGDVSPVQPVPWRPRAAAASWASASSLRLARTPITLRPS
jgi:hypothetical protein